jgi:type II secretory pathway pseudopilin PulG
MHDGNDQHDDAHEGMSNMARLCPADCRVLDALVEVGFDPTALEGLSEDDQSRVDRLMSLFALTRDYPVEDSSEALVHATIAAIDRAERDREDRLHLATVQEATRPTGMRRIFVPDFITVAAVLLIAASIVLPVMSGMRQRSLDAQCENNLRVMGYAFSHYAADYDGTMPVVSQAGLNRSWDMFSNFLHLSPLEAGQYCKPGCMGCPGHDATAGPGYSYQWQEADRARRWNGGRATRIVLGDRNPLLDAIRLGRILAPDSVSLNHGGRGQNVLASDGSTMWLSEPVVGQDNIWLPAGVDGLKPGEIVNEPEDDVFLAH